ncbi:MULTISPECIES: NADH-dependent FMN reductase RutF [unclassified Enterobacter]|uniref:NADH-dependent FMN reductase RutF n=1 Tax=unclassified Enterobacter TaxID=2608935 RepID=UPI00077BEEA5|nr:MULTISPECIES: pyrimidine utilization flavin reductase protein F [unclassified Enterobacter]MBB3305046.1 flavin reductase [Enterobacter sp. Sphag1F]MRT40140.1 pyrimidine utilization flavin reductase protein F [Enterobacteriaceae bacterium RIT702]NYI13862.1 flavin reductase [Enterobacter sp. Sphag71]
MSVHELPVLPAVERDAFRNAMACLGAAVNIITTDGPAGRAGFTASAVCSVTDSPPTLLVCLNRSASVWPIFRDNGYLCVNTLAAGHEELSTLFGGKTPMAERFAAADWHTLASGSPLLDGALVSFDCKVAQVVSVGTHDILFCEVQALVRNDETHGLAWFDRGYHHLLRQDAR